VTSAKNPPPPSPRQRSAEERRAASEKHDAQYFEDQRATAARNLEKTLRLRAERLAHQAANPAPPTKKRR
jgi:hypothetical protein